MGGTRWGRSFFWLVSAGSALVAVVLLVPLVVPLQVFAPVLFVGLVGFIVFITWAAAHPTRRPADRRGGHTGWLVVVGILGALTVAAVLIAVRHTDSPGPEWVRAGTVSDLEREHVVYLSDAQVFVIDGPSGPVALSALDPHLGERIIFCRSSGWFEEPQHGSKYDGSGFYALGPSPRGMDRVGVRVVDGDVWVDPVRMTPGPPRNAEEPEARLGPFCVLGEGDAPGFSE